MPFPLAPAALTAFAAHAIAEYPKEACGVIVEDQGAQRFVPLANAHETPEQDFRIPATLYARHAKETLIILHSHPNGPDCPTAADMAGQITTAKPWGVAMTNGETCGRLHVWGDGAPVPDLIGRVFVHGVTDCYALVRDYYRTEHGIALPEVPRDDAWWVSGTRNLYLEHLEAAGFVRIPAHEARPGDGFLLGIRSTRLNPKGVINHAGVLVEQDLMLHHLPERLSRREPIGPWLNHIAVWVRHAGVHADG